MTLNPVNYFEELQLNKLLQSNLDKNNFIRMTPIQSYCYFRLINLQSVIAISRVGSGKTLAFLLPIIQKLIDLKWTKYDGLGALIVSPTRELAIQTYEVVNQIAQNINLSVGCVTGGHDVKYERQLLEQMNILICTPGRLIQHLQESSFDIGDNIQYIIFDEMDELIQYGFYKQLIEIIKYFRATKCVGLFSATNTDKSIKLMQVFNKVIKFEDEQINQQFVDKNSNQQSFKSNFRPKITTQTLQQYQQYIKEHSKENTAYRIEISQFQEQLVQNIIVKCSLSSKASLLLSLIKSYQQLKQIIFFNTIAEAKFFYNAFTKLNIGCNTYLLTSKQSQNERQNNYFEFKRQKDGVCFCTDLTARGIDIQDIKLSIQFDTPCTVAEYIHRSGRCARANNSGINVLLMNQQEEPFIQKLQEEHVKFQEKNIKLKRIYDVTESLKLLVADNEQIRELAKKAVKAFVRSVVVQADKDVFQLERYNSEEICLCFGLQMSFDISSMKQQNQQQNQKPNVQQKQEQKVQQTNKQVQKVQYQNYDRINQIQNNILEQDEEDKKRYKKMQKLIKEGGDDNDINEIQSFDEQDAE